MLNKILFAIVLSAALVCMFLRHVETSKIQKIEFILYDHQNDNEADLSRDELIKYIEATGASITEDKDHVFISYHGYFTRHDWNVNLSP